VAIVQALGFLAMIAASILLGVRLLRLWGRTRETPELTIGLAFLLAGAAGYSSFSALAVVRQSGGDPHLIKLLTLLGLGFTAIGALCNGIGSWRIFRVGNRWPWALVGTLAALMMIAFVGLARGTPGVPSDWIWVGLLSACAIYAWTTAEALLLSGMLRRRAALGLADPQITSRVFQWAIAGGAVVVVILSAFLTRVVLGLGARPPSLATFQSLCGLGAAGAIWIGFFPPAAYRRWVDARAEA